MKQFFFDENGHYSMKRLTGFLFTVSICVKLINTQTDALVYSVSALAGAAFGYTMAEKIFKK